LAAAFTRIADPRRAASVTYPLAAVLNLAVVAKGFEGRHLRWSVEQSIACLGRDRRRLARGPTLRHGYSRAAAPVGGSSPRR
jgi:hypothetical protein